MRPQPLPSYHSGSFARSQGESAEPMLWPKLGWMPLLGNSGLTLYDIAQNFDIVKPATASWTTSNEFDWNQSSPGVVVPLDVIDTELPVTSWGSLRWKANGADSGVVGNDWSSQLWIDHIGGNYTFAIAGQGGAWYSSEQLVEGNIYNWCFRSVPGDYQTLWLNGTHRRDHLYDATFPPAGNAQHFMVTSSATQKPASHLTRVIGCRNDALDDASCQQLTVDPFAPFRKRKVTVAVPEIPVVGRQLQPLRARVFDWVNDNNTGIYTPFNFTTVDAGWSISWWARRLVESGGENAYIFCSAADINTGIRHKGSGELDVALGGYTLGVNAVRNGTLTCTYANGWMHACVINRPSAGSQYIEGWKNGVQTMTPVQLTAASSSLQGLIIGMRQDSIQAWEGNIFDLRFYSRILTNQEIADLADPTKAFETALDADAHYKLEGKTQANEYDSSGAAAHSTSVQSGCTVDDDAAAPYSFANEVGYSDNAVVVPRDESSILFDALGNPLEYQGKYGEVPVKTFVKLARYKPPQGLRAY